MSKVWAESQQKSNELLLLLAIADNANDNGYCWPGIEYLAEKTRVSRRTVIRLIKRLEDSGELFASHNRRTGNKYVVKTGLSDKDLAAILRKYFTLTDEAISDSLSHKKTEKICDTHVTSEVTQLCHIRSDTAMSLQPSLTVNEPSTLTPNGVVAKDSFLLYEEGVRDSTIEESVDFEEDQILFTTPPPRQRRTTQDVRDGAARAIAKFEKKHRGDNGVDPAWASIPVHQGQILTEFTRLSNIPIPKTKSLRNSATYAAETMYVEIGSAQGVVERLRQFFAERAEGKHDFTITGPNSVVKVICAMETADAGPRVIRLRK